MQNYLLLKGLPLWTYTKAQFRTQWNIYDGAFLQNKLTTLQKSVIIDVELGFKYAPKYKYINRQPYNASV